jgi:hypothetical protein
MTILKVLLKIIEQNTVPKWRLSLQKYSYKDYINLYNKSHIVLDQVFSYDQGYNARGAKAGCIYRGRNRIYGLLWTN